MKCGVGTLGCSVTEIYALGEPYIQKKLHSGGYSPVHDYEVMQDKEHGFKNFVDWARTRGNYETAGICIFADSSNFGNGERLAKWLVKHGARVEKTAGYDNPSHSGKCNVWVWYHREAPKKEEAEKDARLEAVELPKVVAASRPVSLLRRKTLVTKAKTALGRVTSKRSRLTDS